MSNVLKQAGYRELDGLFRIPTRLFDQRERSENLEGKSSAGNEARIKNDQLEAEAKRRAEAILAQATQEAERIQAEAKTAIDAWWNEQRAADEQYKEDIRREAYDEGYRQGYEKGAEKAKRDTVAQLRNARQIVESAYRAKEEIISEAEPFLVDLSIQIAEKVITQQITLEPEVIVSIVHRALEHCHETGVITLLVKPEHFPLVQQAREEFKQAISGAIELQILPDHTLESDGCVIRSQGGSVDARVDVQLNQIQKVLAEVAKEGERPIGDAHAEVPRELEAHEPDSRQRSSDASDRTHD